MILARTIEVALRLTNLSADSSDAFFDADVPLMEIGLDSYVASSFTLAMRQVVSPMKVSDTILFECGTARAIARYRPSATLTS